MLRIIQFQICKPWTNIGTQCIFGLGLDGILYTYDLIEKHWNPITTKRVNPLHKQPKKQQITIHNEGEK
jgi:hypothetical protein